MFLLLLPIAFLAAKSVHGANILFVSAVASPSHHVWNEVLVNGLLEKGHNITMIGHEDAKTESKNYTVLKISGMEEIYDHLDINAFLTNKNSPIEDLYMLWEYIIGFVELDLNSDALEKLMEYPKDSFQLVLFDIVCGHYFYPLIDYFGNPPVVAVSPFALPPYILDAMGSQFYSYFPMSFLTYTDRMTLWQRIENTFLNFLDYYLKWKNMRFMFKMAQTRFGRDIVPFEEVERQFQILLANYEPAVDFAVALTPNIIPVGGLHTKRSSRLPDDLSKILNNAHQGVIYFSFGTNVLPSALTPEKKDIFLNTFSKLKEVVLWKYDDNDLRNIPKNVILRKWYPQNDILGHKNVKAFITHGGGLSTREAMYHGVPVVGIPLFMDQLNNVEKMQVRKLGRRLFVRDLSEDALYETIRDVLTNPTYKRNMKAISKLFRDQKETPLERAVFWIEYTLRHKNLSHLSTSSREMNIYQRENLDIYGFVLICIVFSTVLLAVLSRWFFKFFSMTADNKIKSQ